jgi:soluble lytic murein transglycosylase-like protein
LKTSAICAKKSGMRALILAVLLAAALGGAQGAVLPPVPLTDVASSAAPFRARLGAPAVTMDAPGAARARLWPMIQAEAVKQGVPASLADAVAIVETNYTTNAVGTSGEIGLMQVMPGTAIGLGFHGTMTELFDDATNIRFGVAYLARAWAASGGSPCRALMKYRAGVGEEGFSPLSIQYCQRAAAWLRTQDKALADKVAATTPAVATRTDPNVITLAGRRPTRVDLAAFAADVGVPGVVLEPMGRPAGAGAGGGGLAYFRARRPAQYPGGGGRSGEQRLRSACHRGAGTVRQKEDVLF